MKILIFTLIAISFLFYFITSFELFEVDKVVLEKITITNAEYKIYYIPGNATSISYIQLVKNINGNDSVIKNFKGYDDFIQYNVIDSVYINLILKKINTLDTLILKLE